MADLPALSKSTNRVLELRSKGFLEAYRLTGNAVVQHSSAGEKTRRIALGPLLESTSRYFKNWFQNYLTARRECGISSSVEFAKARFNDLAEEYFKVWSPSTGDELFAAQLEALKEQVLAEVASIWNKSDVTKQWYESVCAPSVDVAVSGKLREFADRARNSEIAFLVRASTSGSEKTGNWILDEIKAAGDDPDAIKRLSPQAQEAMLRAQVMMEVPVPARTADPEHIVERPEQGVKKERARPGPKKRLETAQKVQDIVLRIAGPEPWSSKLGEICEVLDDEKIERPKTWLRRDPPIRSWIDAATTDRDLAKKAIDHHLKNAHS
jgi:hypothetical protein